MGSELKSRVLACSCGVLLCVSAIAAPSAQTAERPVAAKPVTTRPAHDFAKWEKAISAYEKADREHMPPRKGIVFIGSSTIARWKTLAADFPHHPVINRGFGGSEIVDATHFAERIIFPYEPRQIFLRSGGNDIHAGKTAEQVFEDYRDFVKKVHARLPETEIVFMGLSPAPSRWAERDETRKLNELVNNYVKDHRKKLRYIETYEMVLDKNGEARPELFVSDRLHFSPEGYRLLVDKVRPFLVATEAAH